MMYLLISIVLFALNNVLWKKNLQQCSVPFLVSYRALFTSLGSFALLIYIYGFNIYQNQPLGKITLGSIFGVIGLFLMLIVIKKAPLQWLGIYNLAGIVFTAVYLYYFEKTPLFDSLLGLACILFGFVLYLYYNKEKEYKINKLQHVFLLGMTLCFGISSLIHWKNLGTNVPPLLIISNQELVVFICAFCFSKFTMKNAEIKLNLIKYFPTTILMAFIIFLALLFSFLGLQVTNPLMSSILFLATPILTITFGTLFFKEKISIANCIAITIIAAGAFILQYQNMLHK
jgi:drug/metabolite transporter (DMT)-like permease